MITVRLRNLVEERAQGRCEYCGLPETFSLHNHEPDHIVPLQHGGETVEGNLALACLRCNRHKGTNVASFDMETGSLTPLFNPRRHEWPDHFRFDEGVLHPLTPEGRVTVQILRLNDADRIEERRSLAHLGHDWLS